MAVLGGGVVLLCAVHGESGAVQCDVASVSEGVQGDAVRRWRDAATEEPVDDAELPVMRK